MGVTYSATGTCGGTALPGPFFNGPIHAAVDASGNIWIINYDANGAPFVEMSPTGQPLACYNNNAQTYGGNITIDTSGNIWAMYNHRTLTGLIQELPYGSTTPISWTPLASPTAIVADGSGNVFFTTSASGGSLYEIIDPGSTTTPWSAAAMPAVVPALYSTGTVTTNYLAADSVGRIWGANSSNTYLQGAYPSTTAPAAAAITGYSVSSNVVTFNATNSFTVGQIVSVKGLSFGTMFNNQSMVLTAATSSSFSASFTAANVSQTSDSGTATAAPTYTASNTGLETTSWGIAVGTGNYVYTGTACCGSSADKLAEKITPATSAGAGALAGSTQFLGGLIGARAVAVDGAQNIWFGNQFPSTSSGVYGLAEINSSGAGTSATFSAISASGSTPTTCATASSACPAGGGYQDPDFLEPLDIEIDLSGNVWVMNTGTYNGSTSVQGYTGSTVTELIGAAVPVVTPLSVAAAAGKIATKP